MLKVSYLFGLVWQYFTYQKQYNAGKFKFMATYLQQYYNFEPTCKGLSSFQGRGTKVDIVLPKNQHTQRQLLNFVNGCSGEVSKSTKISLSKSIFYVKIIGIFLNCFFIKKFQFFFIETFESINF